MELNKRLLAFVTYFNIFILGLYLSMYQISLLRIADTFSLDAVGVGLIIAMQYLGLLLSPLFIGTLSGRYGKKKILYVSYLMLIAGMLTVSVCSGLIMLCIALVVLGGGFAVMEATSSAVLSDEFPLRSRFHISMSQVMFSIGALIGPVASEALYKQGLTYKDLFLSVGALFLLSGLVSIFVRHQKKEEQAVDEKLEKLYDSFRYLKTLPFIFIAVSLFLYVGIEEITGFYADSYYSLVVKSPESSALSLSLYWGMMIPSRFLGGIIKAQSRTVIKYCSLLLAASLILAMVLPSVGMKIAMFALAGFASGPVWPMIMDSAVQRYRNSTGPVLNILMAICGLGGGTMPFLAGLFANVGGYSLAYCFAAIAAIGIWCAFCGYLDLQRLC